MNIREAVLADIPQMQKVRNSVTENVLSDPSLVTDEACADFITRRGKGWVYEVKGNIVGFAIADLAAHNIWALFLHPSFENKGIGKALHHQMLDWYFAQTEHTVWLSTEPRSRAEGFYRKMGWVEKGIYGKGEVRFEMTAERWRQVRLSSTLPFHLT